MKCYCNIIKIKREGERKMSETKRKLEQQINTSNLRIERIIDQIETDSRGNVSQDMLQYLRTFIQSIMSRVYAEEHEVSVVFGDEYRSIEKATKHFKSKNHFLAEFFDYIQTVASHYTLTPDSSERVMLKYYKYLLETKKFVKKELEMDILTNISKFPLNLDRNTQEYYEKISEVIEQYNQTNTKYNKKISSERYYIHKIKPFFVEEEIYYEITFRIANEKTSKSERLIAFTKQNVSEFYAVNFNLESTTINILNEDVPVNIIVDWKVSLRPVEYEDLGWIFHTNLKGTYATAEARGLMDYLTDTRTNLTRIIMQDEQTYNGIKENVLAKYNAQVHNLFDVLDRARIIMLKDYPGSNVLKYLLLKLNHNIIKNQFEGYQFSNPRLSQLNLKYGTIPFDKMPMCSSLINHNPRIWDIQQVISSEGREHELLARYIKINTSQKGVLFTNRQELESNRFTELDD